MTSRIQTTKQVALADLVSFSGNPRRGDVAAIRESLEATGQYRALVVRSDTREVLAGNHTLAAMRELGYERALVHLVDVDDEAARRIVLADNRTAELAGYDEAALAGLLAEMDDLVGTGWDQSAVDELLATLAPDRAGEDTEPIAAPADPRTARGDLWLLGEHRLLCGDATDSGDVAELMGGGVAEMMWTDPPYGVEYVGKTKRGLTIDGDTATGLRSLLDAAFAVATAALAPGAPVDVAHPPGARSLDFAQAFVGAGWRLHQGLVWVKNTIVLGHSDYHYAHEPILHGYTPGPGRAGRGKHAGSRWYGDNSQSSVLVYDKPAASTEHPTGKPVGLVEQCVRNSTPPGAIVLDPFAGSGSTLIACENLGRRCYAMEIDPAYCDVIVDRWERHTGQTASLQR